MTTPTPENIIYRLEEAGGTLLALPAKDRPIAARSSAAWEAAIESYGWSQPRSRPPKPGPEKIARMREAMAWITLIPVDRYVLRRIVAARSLVHPLTDRHLFPWRRLAALLGTDHKAAQRWHDQGITFIWNQLRRHYD